MNTFQNFVEIAQCDLRLEQDPSDLGALIHRAHLSLGCDDPFDLAASACEIARQLPDSISQVLEEILIRLYAHSSPPDFINIGGGEEFHHLGWMNLNSSKSRLNPHPFKFHPEMTFPVCDGTVQIVYSSSTLNAFDHPTLVRALSEVSRVLRHDGFFIIKLDYDLQEGQSSRVNAIERETFESFLVGSGYSILSTDREKIISRFTAIPKISDSADRSHFYVLARSEIL